MDPLRAIAAKASSIHERMGAELVPSDDASRGETVDALMHLWLWAAAEGDAALFRRRLEWDGLDEASARRAVGPVVLRPDAPLPEWASILAEILGAAGAPRPVERSVDPQDPVPFEELLLPFVSWARLRCEREAGPAYARFADAAHRSLERQLLHLLSGHASRSFYEELRVETALDALDLLVDTEGSTERYDAFVSRMRSESLLPFLVEYAALARVLVDTARLWVAATVELLERFARDAPAIGVLLGAPGEPDVAAVATSLSDPHNGLRSVAILTFDSGRRVVYKPRRLDIDAGWNALLEWLSVRGAPAAFRTFRTLCRGTYGWAECVDYAPCPDEAEARAYYVRAGALLAVVHLLHGTDCHGDNLIAAGAHPVLIDVETMLSPELHDAGIGAEAPRLARKLLTTSVLNTYLLPSYTHALHDDTVFDGSGFGANPEEDRAATYEGWIFVNTDRMKLARRSREVAPAPRAALAGGGVLRVYEYEADLVRGFEEMYRFLVRERASLLADGSPFCELRRAEVRFVHRNTSLYSHVLRLLQQPRFCRDGAERSIQIEQLALLSLRNAALDGRPGWADVWNAERECMARGDVPQFSVHTAGETVVLHPSGCFAASSKERTIPAWFPDSGHSRAVERLARFGEDDMSLQVDFIRSSLRSRAPACGGEAAALPTDAPDDDALLAEAMAIAEWLARVAIRGSDGSASWLEPVWSREYMLANRKREMDVVGHDLYDGAVGIGLFLAVLESRTNAGLGELAAFAARPLLVELQEHGERIAEDLGIGGLSGLGSVVYGLTQIGSLLENEELLTGAERAARFVTARRIADDGTLDVTTGAAGALLGLLSLNEVVPRDDVVAAATTCADRLLARLEPTELGVRAIRTLGGRFLSGFSHGAAGISHALCRLHRVTGEARLLSAARELVEFERRTFAEAEQNWPDLRDPALGRFMLAWCHGAPGIALARVGNLASMDDERTRAEIEHALRLTLEHRTGRADFLCCGTAGIAGILAATGLRLARPSLVAHARALVWETSRRARGAGDYVLALPSSGRLRAPGLFRGLSGIGLTLVQLARPGGLPEPLLLC
jgi:type 2 lantibiotic biosynthesis protein LanM